MAVDSKRDVIYAAIADAARTGDGDELLLRLGFIGINPQWLRGVFDEFYNKQTRVIQAGKIAAAIHEELDRIISDALVISTAGEVDLLYASKCIKEALLGYIEYFDVDWRIVVRYREFLLSKRRQLVKRDKWGDIDQSEWGRYLAEFCEEKLNTGKLDAALNKFIPAPILSRLRVANIQPLGIIICIRCLECGAESGGQFSASPASPVPHSKALNGIDYELNVQKNIENYFPALAVEMTPTSGDQGADIIVSSKERKIAIQVKLYSGAVGNSAVQEAHAARAFYDADECMVISSSSYTASARVLASKTGVVLATDQDYLDILSDLAGVGLKKDFME